MHKKSYPTGHENLDKTECVKFIKFKNKLKQINSVKQISVDMRKHFCVAFLVIFQLINSTIFGGGAFL